MVDSRKQYIKELCSLFWFFIIGTFYVNLYLLKHNWIFSSYQAKLFQGTICFSRSLERIWKASKVTRNFCTGEDFEKLAEVLNSIALADFQSRFYNAGLAQNRIASFLHFKIYWRCSEIPSFFVVLPRSLCIISPVKTKFRVSTHVHSIFSLPGLLVMDGRL